MNILPLDTVPLDAAYRARVHIGYAPSRFVLTMRAVPRPPWLISRELARYVGRCQIGQAVSLFSNCVPGGRPIQPISAGSFRIYGGPEIRTGLLPTEVTDAETIGLFRGYFKADNTDHPGRYTCVVTYTVAGFPKSVSECMVFELEPGGHQLGAIMQTFAVPRPSGSTVLSQTESGKLCRGALPYLDEGV